MHEDSREKETLLPQCVERERQRYRGWEMAELQMLLEEEILSGKRLLIVTRT